MGFTRLIYRVVFLGNVFILYLKFVFDILELKLKELFFFSERFLRFFLYRRFMMLKKVFVVKVLVTSDVI